MTKGQAIHNFFNGFGVKAYPITSLPNDVTFPYMTYEPAIAGRGKSVNSTVNLWDYSESEADINAKADEIQQAIAGGASIHCSDGAIYAFIDAWSPITNENDTAIKGRTANITLTFNTL